MQLRIFVTFNYWTFQDFTSGEQYRTSVKDIAIALSTVVIIWCDMRKGIYVLC